jgi:hypothetical protein
MKTLIDYYEPAQPTAPITQYYPAAGSDAEQPPMTIENPHYYRKWLDAPIVNEQQPSDANVYQEVLNTQMMDTQPQTPNAAIFQNYGEQTPVDYVTSLYHSLLNRDPDTSGLQAWTNYIAQGGSFEDVRQGFLGSQEYLHSNHDLTTSLVPTNPSTPLIPDVPPVTNPNPVDPTSPVNTNDPNSLAGELGSLFDLLNLSQLAHEPVTASGGQDKGGYLVVPTASPEQPTSATYGPKIFLILAIVGIAVTIFFHFHDKGK